MLPRSPHPKLLVTARPAKQPKRRKPEAEKAATKKALDKARSQTRVSIGEAFERWRRLKQQKGLKSDAEVAVYLLDRYSADTAAEAPEDKKPVLDQEIPETIHIKDENMKLWLVVKREQPDVEETAEFPSVAVSVKTEKEDEMPQQH